MERMTLRTAAERSSRSVTTLRRYIRSGRLHAEKRYGRFGPEYFVSDHDLSEAGLEPVEPPAASVMAGTSAPGQPGALARPVARGSAEGVPLTLYQDLQMKHEQLLVQYGMMRAGGLRMMEVQGELEAKREELERAEGLLASRRQDSGAELPRLKHKLRAANLELEGRALEIAALHEKVRALEMLTRNAVTNESVEKQFGAVMDQSRKVDRLARATINKPGDSWPAAPPRGPKDTAPEH